MLESIFRLLGTSIRIFVVLYKHKGRGYYLFESERHIKLLSTSVLDVMYTKV